MADNRARAILLFENTLEKIRRRTFPEPNAWERYQLFEALGSIVVSDFEAAESALLRLSSTPEVKDLAPIWKTPQLSLRDISNHFHKVKLESA
jgi:hypothetical protein